MSQNMPIEQMKALVVDSLEDIKAKDIVALKTSHLTELFDYMIIASADSNRQAEALSRHLQDKVREHKIKVIGAEGSDDWLLIDLGDILVHIMHPRAREFYNIEELWGGKSYQSVA